MFYVYILYSQSLDRYYVGQTENLNDRIFRHTNSGSKSTKAANDWVLKHKEEFNSRSEALKRESEIKKKKSRKYLDWLVSSAG
jgi:putative endonuclease